MTDPASTFKSLKEHLDFIRGLADEASREGRSLFKEAHRYRVVAAGGGLVLVASQFDGAVWQGKIFVIIAVLLCLLSLFYSYLAVISESQHQAKIATKYTNHVLSLLERADEYIEGKISTQKWANSSDPPDLLEPANIRRYRNMSLSFLRQAALASLAFMISVLVQEF
jgi:hypothetical protein